MYLDIELIIIFTYSVNSAYLVKQYAAHKCLLSNQLKQEIAQYKGAIKEIMNEIKYNHGETMYQEYVKFIDTFGARPAGSEILEKSIDYMINLTQRMGFDDITTEEVQLLQWVRGDEMALMIEPLPKTISILGLGYSISTPPEGIIADVIVVQSFEELDATDKSLVQGKIVVYNENYTTYPNTLKYLKQGASEASKKGAVGALVRSIAPFSLYTPHTGVQHYEDGAKKIPVAAITIEDAQLFLRLQTSGKNITIHMKMCSTYRNKTSRNTIIDLKGSQCTHKQVIVSGHIDSWDVGQGAMDDGGGLFISWFTPIVLKKLNYTPKRTIRAILWTAEEYGCIGAAAYLKKHKEKMDDINFMMESDEGTFKPEGLNIVGTFEARCIMSEVLKLFDPITKLTNGGAPPSDITLFTSEGVPGASLLNANEKYFWYHHTEADTLLVQNKEHVIECAAFWTAYSYVIADLSSDLPRH